MASAVRETRHRGKQTVNGSLAYDLEWAVRERELRHAGEVPKGGQKALPKVHAAPRIQIRERQYVSWVAVLGVMAIVGLSILVLMYYVQLTVLSSETVRLRNELEELKTENVILTAEYEQMFDMATVKEAAEAAGMGKPSSSQIYHLDLSGGDSAVIYQKEEPGLFSRLLSSLHGGIYAVVEYFD